MGCGKVFKAAVGIGLAFATGGASLLASPVAMASLALGTVGTLTGNKFLSMAGMGLSLATGLTKGFGTAAESATSSAADTAASATNGGFIESVKAVDNPFTSGMSPGSSAVENISSAVEKMGGAQGLLGSSNISNELAASTQQPQITDIMAPVKEGGVFPDNSVSGIVKDITGNAATPSIGTDAMDYGSLIDNARNTTSTVDAAGGIKSITQWMEENKELVNLGGGLLKGAMSGMDNTKMQELYNKKLKFEMDQINQQNANANTIIGVGRMVNDNAPNLYYRANQARYPNGAPA